MINHFQTQTNPIGLWPSTDTKRPVIRKYVKEILIALGAAYGILFGIGYCLMLNWLLGCLCLVLGMLCTYALIQSHEIEKKTQSL